MTTIPQSDPNTSESQFELTVQVKDNGWFQFFWGKKHFILGGDKKLKIFSNQQAALNPKSKPEIIIPCTKIDFHQIQNSKPHAILLSVLKSSTNYAVAPLEKESKMTEEEYQNTVVAAFEQLQKKIVGFGGTETKTVKKNNSLFASVAPEVAVVPILQTVERISIVNADSWDVDDVQTWLSYVRDNEKSDPLLDSFGELFKNNSVDGPTLLTLNDSTLKQMGFDAAKMEQLKIEVKQNEGGKKIWSACNKLGVRQKLLTERDKLIANNGFFNPKQYTVLAKLNKMKPAQFQHVKKFESGGMRSRPEFGRGISAREYEEKAKMLSDIETIKKTYLEPDYKKFLEIPVISTKNEETPQDNEKAIEESEEENDDSTLVFAEDTNEKESELIDEMAKKESEEQFDFEYAFKDSVFKDGEECIEIPNVDLKKQQDMESYLWKNLKKLPIKLVITELHGMDKNEKLKRSIFSMILSGLPSFAPKFGLFHTAVIVGPWYLEWLNNSLCIPKRICSSNAILAMDIESLDVPKASVDEVVHKLAELISEWNTTYVYKQTNKKAREGNCQDFVEAVFDKLNVNWKEKIGGAMREYLNLMKEQGECELIFRPNAQFRKAFDKVVDKEAYKFETHEELDKFVHKLKNHRQTIKEEFSNEWKLLKAFDRGFWCRHYKAIAFPNEEPAPSKYMPNQSPDPVTKELRDACPFSDPRITGTMVQ